MNVKQMTNILESTFDGADVRVSLLNIDASCPGTAPANLAEILKISKFELRQLEYRFLVQIPLE